MTIIRVIDLETTGTEPTDQVVEIGAVDVNLETTSIEREFDGLVKPTIPMPPIARAVHHISDDDVKSAPTWEATWPGLTDNKIERVGITHFCAHNAKFEEQWITAEMRGNRPMICTYKVALRIWPDAPKHSNMVLRYWLDLLPGVKGDHHRALFDAKITAALLLELLKHTTIEQMVAWSAEPALMSKITFGKHKGSAWNEVPPDYLIWVAEKSDLDSDTKWNAQREIDRRNQEFENMRAERASGEAKIAYVGLAKTAIKMALSVSDLERWFREESANRSANGIAKGSAEFAEIVSACVERKTQLSSESTQDSQKRAAPPTTEKQDEVPFIANAMRAG